MTRFDLTPLFRTTVGFDSLFRLFDEMAEAPTSAYPPYNIEKLSEDRYRISMAVAGFSDDDLTVELKQNLLTIKGSLGGDTATNEASASNGSGNGSANEASASNGSTSGSFLHRGIAERAFSRQFSLAEHVRVDQARLANGLLHIELLREVPEEAKSRRIPINAANDSRVISASAGEAIPTLASTLTSTLAPTKQTLAQQKKSA